MKVVHQILACLVSLLLVLLVIEGGLRLLGFAPRPTMNRFDPVLGWTKEPSTSIRRGTSEFDVRLETNRRGLREDESLGYEKPSGVTRVLVVGDSFTLGYTVDRESTIPALLEQRLASAGSHVEVINGGTEGYSTDQEVLWLDREGRRYAPDVVVLQMYENDIFWNGQDRYLHYPKPRFSPDGKLASGGAALVDPGRDPWLVRHTALGALLAKAFSSSDMPRLPGPRGLPAEWGARLAEDAPGLPETQAALAAFARITREMGARPLVLVIPDKAQISPRASEAMAGTMGDPRYDPERPFLAMVERARQAHLPVVDPRVALRAASKNDEVALYFERDWHTNAAGNRVLAEELAASLAAPELLGAAPRAAAPWPDTPDEAVVHRWREVLIVLAIWLVLGTLYYRRFPDQGWATSFGGVGGLVLVVVLLVVGIAWLSGLLPLWLQRWVPLAVVGAILGAALWSLRRRLPIMAELFGTFVRRGQWYVLPVLAGLLSVGGLLVVAASSPWLAPFIYTLF